MQIDHGECCQLTELFRIDKFHMGNRPCLDTEEYLSMQVARAKGIPTRLHYTLIIVFFPITFTVSVHLMPNINPGLYYKRMRNVFGYVDNGKLIGVVSKTDIMNAASEKSEYEKALEIYIKKCTKQCLVLV